jgi:hypothetical protein
MSQSRSRLSGFSGALGFRYGREPSCFCPSVGQVSLVEHANIFVKPTRSYGRCGDGILRERREDESVEDVDTALVS